MSAVRREHLCVSLLWIVAALPAGCQGPQRAAPSFAGEGEPARPAIASPVSVEISTAEAQVGVPIYLWVTVSGMHTEPSLPDIPGARLGHTGRENSGGPEGRIRYEYALTFQKEGDFRVPAIPVRTKFKTYQTEPLAVRVGPYNPEPISIRVRNASREASPQPVRVPARSETPSARPAGSRPADGKPVPKRFSYSPRPYPLDERGFSPVGKALEKAMAREEKIADDADGSLNPYVMKVVSAYPLDGSYPYHCGWTPREYDLYNGVTEDMWYKGMVVAKAYPDGSRCSYCCGLTFEIFIRAMKLRNIAKGLDPDDFNGMTFTDLFNMLQLWYIEGPGDCEQRAITSYGLGRAVTDFEEVRPGDFLSYSTTPAGGHSVIFVDWIRDEVPASAPAGTKGRIVGLKYFSSNLSGSKGPGYGQGRFSDSNPSGKGLLRKSLRIARVGAIKDYKPFDRLTIPARNAYLPTQPDRILYVTATQPE